MHGRVELFLLALLRIAMYSSEPLHGADKLYNTGIFSGNLFPAKVLGYSKVAKSGVATTWGVRSRNPFSTVDTFVCHFKNGGLLQHFWETFKQKCGFEHISKYFRLSESKYCIWLPMIVHIHFFKHTFLGAEY